MSSEKMMQAEEGLVAAEWDELTELVEECPKEAEIIMEMLIDADEDELEADAA